MNFFDVSLWIDKIHLEIVTGLSSKAYGAALNHDHYNILNLSMEIGADRVKRFLPARILPEKFSIFLVSFNQVVRVFGKERLVNILLRTCFINRLVIEL